MKPDGDPIDDSATIASARRTILDQAVAEAKLVGADHIRIDRILQAAHASSSSLYHHFGNRRGLIRAVLAELVRDSLLAEDSSLLEVVDGLEGPDEFAAFMAAQLRRLVEDPATIERRRARLVSATAGLTSPVEAQRWNDQVGHLHDATAAFMRRAIERGLCNPDLDPVAYAVFFTSLSLGQLTAGVRTDLESWLRVATTAALAPLQWPGS